jgi:hypothetical protein
MTPRLAREVTLNGLCERQGRWIYPYVLLVPVYLVNGVMWRDWRGRG